MNLVDLATKSPEEFAKLVARLRDLGVVRLTEGEIVLGLPAKIPDATIEHQPRDSRSPAEKKRDVLFAATRFRPALPEDPAPTSNVPRAVVMRRERDGARNGGQGTQG